MTQYEREEEQLERDFAEGRIDQAEFNKQIREMEASYRAEAREAAQGAYDRELDRW